MRGKPPRLRGVGYLERGLVDALFTGSEARVGTTDVRGAVLMRGRGLREICSFDKDFERFEDLGRTAD